MNSLGLKGTVVNRTYQSESLEIKFTVPLKRIIFPIFTDDLRLRGVLNQDL